MLLSSLLSPPMQASPAFAPLRCDARMASTLLAVTSWVVRLEQWGKRPTPPLSSSPPPLHGGNGQGGNQTMAPMPPLSGPTCGVSTAHGSLRPSPPLQPPPPQRSGLIRSHHVVQNRQSVWCRFELPRWVLEEAEEDEEPDEEGLAQPSETKWNVSGM